MGKVKIFLQLFCVLAAVGVYYKTKQLFSFPKKPIVEDTWWGPGKTSKAESSIKPFKINISEDVSMVCIHSEFFLIIYNFDTNTVKLSNRWHIQIVS